MNKKFLLLTAFLVSSLAITPVQANWQDWVLSKKGLAIGGLAFIGATAAVAKYFFYQKSVEMVDTAENEFAGPGYKNNAKFLAARVTLEAHGQTPDLYNNYSFYLTNSDKSVWHKALNWLVKRDIKHFPSARSKADQY